MRGFKKVLIQAKDLNDGDTVSLDMVADLWLAILPVLIAFIFSVLIMLSPIYKDRYDMLSSIFKDRPEKKEVDESKLNCCRRGLNWYKKFIAPWTAIVFHNMGIWKDWIYLLTIPMYSHAIRVYMGWTIGLPIFIFFLFGLFGAYLSTKNVLGFCFKANEE